MEPASQRRWVAQPYLWAPAIRAISDRFCTGSAARDSGRCLSAARRESRPRARVHPAQYDARRGRGNDGPVDSRLPQLFDGSRGERDLPCAASRLGAANRAHVALPAIAAVHGTKWMAPPRSGLWRLGHGWRSADAAQHGSRGSLHDAVRARGVARRPRAIVRFGFCARPDVRRTLPEYRR